MTIHSKLDLLPVERSAMMFGNPPISTITFFRGSPHAAREYFENRVAVIVNHNPWLASMLDWDENGKLALYINEEAKSRCCFHVNKDIQVALSKCNYNELLHLLCPTFCKTAKLSVGTNEPLWKVTLIPDAEQPDERFALVVSVNHTLLDAGGFYRIYEMLSSASSVQSLNAKRKQQVPAHIDSAMGGEVSFFRAPPSGFTWRMKWSSWLFSLGRTKKASAFIVSQDWIQRKKQCVDDEDVEFLSTNDVLMSEFCKCAGEYTAVLMPVDFRDRVPDCSRDDMGNYVDLLVYTPADYASPALIRKSVSGGVLKRASVPQTRLPSDFQHFVHGSYGNVTNWSRYATSLECPSAEEELHVPFFDVTVEHIDMVVIFRAAERKVGMVIIASDELIEKVKATGMFEQQILFNTSE